MIKFRVTGNFSCNLLLSHLPILFSDSESFLIGQGDMPYTGELIAIVTVLCWTVSVQFFEAAAKRVGSTPVNIIRITTALVLFGIFYF